MANPQHVEWLLEGVEAWNARRERNDFEPDFFAENLSEKLKTANLIDKNGKAYFTGVNLRGAYLAEADIAGANFTKANLTGAFLAGADLTGASFTGADLRGAYLKGVYLVGVDLREADLRGVNLTKANLTEANLTGADLTGADLPGADLRRTDLTGTILTGTILRGANVKTLISPLSINNTATGYYTSLAHVLYLTKSQLATMNGDTGVILPDDWKHPIHWPEWDVDEGHIIPPALPPTQNAGDKIDLTENRLTLGVDPAPPSRSDLESIFDDMLHAATDFKSLGNIGNMSQIFASALDRFLKTLPENYIDLEQTRFAVGIASLRLSFQSEEAELEQSAPEKIGHIKAILYAADLLIARLPEWQTFLAEENDDYKIIAENPEEAQSILQDAADHLQNAPDTFDPSIFQRIREYLETKSVEGYLAGQALLTNIAHKTFQLVLDFTKDTISETRKGIIKKIATALQIELGAVLLKLANLLPNELQWLVNWLEYLPTIL